MVMVKRGFWIVAAVVLWCGYACSSYADSGEMGYFGGISEGSNLPKTIEKYVDNKKTSTTKQYQYKEFVFITGEPIEVEGILKITLKEPDMDKEPTGTYTEKYDIQASNIEKNVSIDRTIQFETSYRLKEGDFNRQIKRDSEVTNWDEIIKVNEESYTLNDDFSSFYKSGVEELTPGISYYDTSISYYAQYVTSEDDKINVSVYGSVYGYDQPWSKVETQQVTMTIQDKELQMEIELNPSMESKKTIEFDKAQPFPISFEGTYNQIMERESSLKYRINTFHPDLASNQLENSILIQTPNQVEKLIIPECLDILEQHWSIDDIKKLYSMEILTERPKSTMPYETMPRGEFVKALCLAMNIDTKKYTQAKDSEQLMQVFADVPREHPYYPYVMAAYDAKLIKGTGSDFRIDEPITREAAFVIYIRVIGLERLGITRNPVTPFTDHEDIAEWARKEIQAGYILGIIEGDNANRVLPKQLLSKAQAATIINRLIDYLREEIVKDYRNLML